jgi:hypothetical protein
LIAQQHQPVRDTTDIYYRIEKFSNKNAFMRMMYRAVFNTKHAAVSFRKQREVNYEKYRGKIIRNIIITTLDPFGYNLRDTSAKPVSLVQKGGNFLHDRSARLTIRNQLLIKKGKPLDPLKVKESERILRQSVYVRDVLFEIKPVKGSRDSVDVYIKEQDVWSISFAVGVSPVKLRGGYTDKNFLGLAHQLNVDYYHYWETNMNYLKGNYIVPNIGRTFIRAAINFNSNPSDYDRGFSISRPFFSPLTKWAGGVDVNTHKSSGSYSINSELPPVGFATRYHNQDAWIGRSFKLLHDSSETSRSTSFVTSFRYNAMKFTNQPPAFISSPLQYENSTFYLAGFGISNRAYYRDFFIYRYGVPEDVPSGRLIGVLLGYEIKASAKRFYAGVQVGAGNHYDQFGYLNYSVGVGSFFRSGDAEQSVVRSSVGYFSDLIGFEKWNVRQFIKAQMIYGLKRMPGESVNINEENGIKGFESSVLSGTNKLVLSFQTQAYLPYEFIGFHFAPFIFFDFAFIGNDQSSFFKSQFYQAYGLGLLLKNELLIMNTFQFTVGFYPYIPGTDHPVFKYNPIQNYNFTFNDFGFDKPSPIAFQ